MSKIQVLDNFIAEQIAAGEVIERPSSVIKELVENAIDADAHNITVEIKNGGITYMRISDDGIGMSGEDAQKCVLRHATSKIKSLNDLFSIDTLGFRGEALASVCVVSKLQIITKEKESVYGNSLYFEGGKLQSIEEAGCPNGTTVIVRDLFYNTPARMKFLKKDSSEASKVQNVVEKMALSKPEIAFTFIKDDNTIFKTTGNKDLKQCIYNILGKEIHDNLIEVNYNLNDIFVKGYISSPLTVRGNRGLEVFFVNGRYITTKILSVAVEQAYRNSIMKGKYPICVLNISINSSNIDINVHPAKLEAKFSDEKKVFDTLYFACKNALENKDYLFDENELNNVIKYEEKQTSISYNNISNNVFSQDKLSSKSEIDVTHLYNTFNNKEDKSDENIPMLDEDIPNLINIDFSIEDNNKNDKIETEELNIYEKTKNLSDDLKVIGEVFKTYIIFEFKNKLCILDKHAAHERIIFNRLKHMDLLKDVQQMIVPLIIELNSYDFEIYLNNEETIKNIGFICEEFGNQSIKISAVPIFLMEKNLKDIFMNCLSEIDKNKNSDKNAVLDNLLHTISCRSAIKAGDFTSDFEMRKFVEQVVFDDNVRYCPHGRPCIREFDKAELEKMFKRIV